VSPARDFVLFTDLFAVSSRHRQPVRGTAAAAVAAAAAAAAAVAVAAAVAADDDFSVTWQLLWRTVANPSSGPPIRSTDRSTRE